MHRPLMLLSMSLLGLMSCLTLVSAMEPDEKALQDPAFTAEYGCLPEHFLIKKYFEKEEWVQALTIIEYLEGKGYADAFLTVAKGKALTRMGEYGEALNSFRQALDEGYKCGLTAPRNFAPHPELFRQAILWHYISQVHEAMGNQNRAVAARTKAEDLLKRSYNPPYEDEEEIKDIMTRAFSLFSLFQNPLRP